MKNKKMTSKNKKLILTLIPAIVAISVMLIGLTYNNQPTSSDQSDVKGTWPPPGGYQSTGIPHIVAMKITPRADNMAHEITENQMKSSVSWLDKATTKASEKAQITSEEVEQFFSATADGNTDFKVVGSDGKAEYYRLYLVEVVPET